VKKARELCEDLLSNVKDEYEKFKERGPSHDRYGGGFSNGRPGYGDRGDRDRSASYGYGGSYGGHGGQQSSGAHPSAMSPVAAAPGTPGQPGGDYAAQYAQYYAGGQDPYAAYGGYQIMLPCTIATTATATGCYSAIPSSWHRIRTTTSAQRSSSTSTRQRSPTTPTWWSPPASL